jgi:hypothetical protein
MLGTMAGFYLDFVSCAPLVSGPRAEGRIGLPVDTDQFLPSVNDLVRFWFYRVRCGQPRHWRDLWRTGSVNAQARLLDALRYKRWSP